MQAKMRKISKSKRKIRYFFARAVLFLFLFFILAIAVLFVDFTYKTFSMKERDVQTDAIVVLAGGRGRIDEGIRLYKSGQATYLFLVGVGPAITKERLFPVTKGAPGIEGVFVERASRNTLENALYAREMMEKRDIRSMKLITSRYHLKRATLIFRNIFPSKIAIYPHPVDTKNLKVKWWSHGGSFRLLFSEFYKYCLFRFIFLFDFGELKAEEAIRAADRLM